MWKITFVFLLLGICNCSTNYTIGKYSKISNRNISDAINTANYIGSYILTKTKCLGLCNQISYCYLVVVEEKMKICRMYAQFVLDKQVSSTGSDIYISLNKKTVNTNGLINYWPINDGSIRDFIGTSDMTSFGTTQNVQDRFGNPNSAVYCIDGYYQIPGGYYITGPYTLIAWVNMPNFNKNWPRIMDFSNSNNSLSPKGLVVLGFYSNIQLPQNQLYSSSSAFIVLSASSKPVDALVWNHIAAVNDGSTIKIYINGTLYATTPMNGEIPSLFRSNCYFCCDFRGPNYTNEAYLDDLKIYNRSLTQQEVIDDFN